jgi:hypothetical protein
MTTTALGGFPGSILNYVKANALNELAISLDAYCFSVRAE